MQDQQVLHLVNQCRLVNSEQLYRTLALRAELDGRSINQRAFLRRLQQLFHAGYLDRPPAQIQRWKGTMPYVYALGPAGQTFLYPNARKSAQVTKNQRIKAAYIDHRLTVSEAVLAFDAAARLHGLACEWFEATAFRARTGFAARYNVPQTRWVTAASGRRQQHTLTEALPLNPDAYVVLTDCDGGAYHYFLEVDLGTEPLSRDTSEQTSIDRKLVLYYFLNAHVTDQFDVLTITTTATRRDNMRERARALDPKGKGGLRKLLFTTADNITLADPARILVGAIWHPPQEDAAALSLVR